MPEPPTTTVPALDSTVVLTAGPGVASTGAGLERHHGIPLTKKKCVLGGERGKKEERRKKKKELKKKKEKQKMTLMEKKIFFKKKRYTVEGGIIP